MDLLTVSLSPRLTGQPPPSPNIADIAQLRKERLCQAATRSRQDPVMRSWRSGGEREELPDTGKAQRGAIFEGPFCYVGKADAATVVVFFCPQVRHQGAGWTSRISYPFNIPQKSYIPEISQKYPDTVAHHFLYHNSTFWGNDPSIITGGRCEIWIRPLGIQATQALPGPEKGDLG